MELVAYDERADDGRLTVTLKLTDAQLADIGACLGYLVSTFDDQDSVLLSLPGEQGRAVVQSLSNDVHAIVLQLNRLTIPGYTR